jgi:hypothetical protein
MPVPETTSAEAFERYVGGRFLVACRGKAWRDIRRDKLVPQRKSLEDLIMEMKCEQIFKLWIDAVCCAT